MNKRYIPVENNKDLVRDIETKAILNINNEALEAYKKNRDRARDVDRVINEHEQIKNELNEIKNLLQKLIQKI